MTVAMNDLNTIRPATREFLAAAHANLIGGSWVPAASGKTLSVVDPATGQEITRVAESDAADIDHAVQAARNAFESAAWRDMKPATRERLMNRLADLMEQNIDTLAELESMVSDDVKKQESSTCLTRLQAEMMRVINEMAQSTHVD